MLKRAVLTLLSLLVVSVILVAAISFSASCVNEASQHNAAQDERSQDQNSYSQRVFASLECGTSVLGTWVIDHLNEISTVITALATVAIGIFTFTLYEATTQQARITNDTLKLARDEFVASWRPKLRVRNIIASDFLTGLNEPQIFTSGHSLQYQFYVSNIGGTAARITEAFAMTFQRPSGLPMARPYEGKSGNLPVPSETLYPGQSIPFSFTNWEIMDDSAKTIGSQVIGHQRLFVMGWIVYQDDIGIARRTAFCREFMQGPWDDGRFCAVSDPDYEYEE